MAGKRVTYLIGAGASANALPVVNGLSERMRIFYNYICRTNEIVREFGPRFHSFKNIEILLEEIEQHYTIDTLAKKYFLKNDDKYNLLKEFTAGYFLFEQSEKDKVLLEESIWKLLSEKKYLSDGKEMDRKKIFNSFYESITKKYDYRYDSFFATLLEGVPANLNMPSEINVISWNYDNQFEMAYSQYLRTIKGLYPIQSALNIYPSDHELDVNKSSIVKLNGTANYSGKVENRYHDPLTDKFDKQAIERVRSIDDDSVSYFTNMQFAWEKEAQVVRAREHAQSILLTSDVVVIIGYSFPTFNREVDREIFKQFNSNCIERRGVAVTIGWKPEEKFRIRKKIYIQDMPENAPKIRERLKAIGNNLFDVAEVYDDVDQFLIPYEL